jgi:hypothetical protein
MIDPNLLLNDFEGTARRLARKGVQRETLAEVRDVLEKRRAQKHQLDEQRALLKSSSRQIGQLMQEGKQDQAEARREAVTIRKEELTALEKQLNETEDRIRFMLLRLPNLPSDESPEGKDEQDNLILRIHGYDADNYRSKVYKPHWEIASELGMYDAERAAKMSGSGFALLRRQGVKLLRALVQFGIDLNSETYEEILPPTLFVPQPSRRQVIFLNSKWTHTSSVMKTCGRFRLVKFRSWAFIRTRFWTLRRYHGGIWRIPFAGGVKLAVQEKRREVCSDCMSFTNWSSSSSARRSKYKPSLKRCLLTPNVLSSC